MSAPEDRAHDADLRAGLAALVEAAARGIHAHQEYSTCWDDERAGSLSRLGTKMRPLGEHGKAFYRGLAEAALLAAHPAPAPHDADQDRLTAPDAECDCYPGGFTADTYEGPKDDCPVHGRTALDDVEALLAGDILHTMLTADEQPNSGRMALAILRTVLASDWLRERDERAAAALAAEEAAHADTIDQRDEAQEWADRLAYSIASVEVIGEHSSANNPWENALDVTERAAADRAAQVERVEAALASRPEFAESHFLAEFVAAIRAALTGTDQPGEGR